MDPALPRDQVYILMHSGKLVEQVYAAMENQRHFMRVRHIGDDGNLRQCYPLAEG